MRCEASVTVEAAFVIPIIFFVLMLIIQRAYIIHDTVSGSMILEESVERVRYRTDHDLKPEVFADQGEEAGNPRLWLGSYTVEITEDLLRTGGKASAGDWREEIDMNTFDPARYLRVTRAAQELWSTIHDDTDTKSRD